MSYLELGGAGILLLALLGGTQLYFSCGFCFLAVK